MFIGIDLAPSLGGADGSDSRQSPRWELSPAGGYLRIEPGSFAISRI